MKFFSDLDDLKKLEDAGSPAHIINVQKPFFLNMEKRSPISDEIHAVTFVSNSKRYCTPVRANIDRKTLPDEFMPSFSDVFFEQGLHVELDGKVVDLGWEVPTRYLTLPP